MIATPKTCAVCTRPAGVWFQHANQPSGIGICFLCVNVMKGHGLSEAEVRARYGIEGKNWGRHTESPWRVPPPSKLDLQKPICTRHRRSRCELLYMLPPHKAIDGDMRLVVLVHADDPEMRSIETFTIDGRLMSNGTSQLDLINVPEART
jgi:hypothetical protein